MSDHQNINHAMLAFSQEFAGAHKTGVNPHFNSEHFTLDDVTRAVNPILHKHGMYMFHAVEEVNGAAYVGTTIIHAKSGSSISSSIPIPKGLDAQKTGGCVTYFKRYNACALCSISEIDDDGNIASAPDLATREQLAVIQEFREKKMISPKQEKWLADRDGRLLAQDAEQVIKGLKRKEGEIE